MTFSALHLFLSVAYWVADMKNCTMFEFSSVKLYLFHHNVTKYDLGLGCNQEHSTETWKVSMGPGPGAVAPSGST